MENIIVDTMHLIISFIPDYRECMEEMKDNLEYKNHRDDDYNFVIEPLADDKDSDIALYVRMEEFKDTGLTELQCSINIAVSDMAQMRAYADGYFNAFLKHSQ